MVLIHIRLEARGVAPDVHLADQAASAMACRLLYTVASEARGSVRLIDLQIPSAVGCFGVRIRWSSLA